MKKSFDVCVVGSGPGGGIAAYVLAKAGLKVALVEAGKSLRAGVDYNTHAWPYEITERRLRGEKPSMPRLTFESNHFTSVGDRPAHGWLKAVGGRSLCWAGHSLRFGPLDFKHWPITYDEVAPYYSRAEKFIGVYGYKDGLYNLPDGEFLQPVRMRCPDEVLKRGVSRLKATGRKMEYVSQRKAILSEAHWSTRAPCHYCGRCMQGCDVESKYTSANTPIPLALKTGNLTLFTESMMTRIMMETSGRRVKGIEYTSANNQVGMIEAKAVVLACNSIETPRHLLLNTSREFPDGLSNSSGQVGRNLTSHFGVTVVAYFKELRNRDTSNDDGTDYYHGLLTGLYWDQPSKDFEGTYQVQVGSGVYPNLRVKNVTGFGSKLKRELREKNAGHASMNMQGSLLVSPNKFVDLDPEKRDRFGCNLSRIHLHYEQNDIAMAKDMVETCEQIIRAAGGEVISKPGSITEKDLVIDSNHWVGTCRMGHDRKTSVVNAHGQSHDIPNLFIGDASVFAAYPEKNPTLTNITLSWRMSDNLVEKFRRSEV